MAKNALYLDSRERDLLERALSLTLSHISHRVSCCGDATEKFALRWVQTDVEDMDMRIRALGEEPNT